MFKCPVLTSQGTQNVSSFFWRFFLLLFTFLSYVLPRFFLLLLFLLLHVMLFCLFLLLLRPLTVPSAVSSCLCPVCRLSLSHISTQPVINDPPAPTVTNMNLNTSGLSPEFEPSPYLLNASHTRYLLVRSRRKEHVRERHCINHLH